MRATQIISIFIIIVSSSCVDRLIYDIKRPDELPVVIIGHITNEPGPYVVNLTRNFDIQSKTDLRIPVSATHVNMMDELGTNETLTETTPGTYQTSVTGIQGRVGGIYTLRVEFNNGSIFESTPDTLREPGALDSLYHEFNTSNAYTTFSLYGWNSPLGFDVRVNSNGTSQANTYYKWDMTGTFEAVTKPEGQDPECWSIPLEGIPCNFLLPCTGLRNATYARPSVGPIDLKFPSYRRAFPCSCCKCWYNFSTDLPVIYEPLVAEHAVFKGKFIQRIPLVDWLFMFKIHLNVSQSSISRNTYTIFDNIIKQKKSVSSLFQPINGHIPTNFVQVSGNPTQIDGIFYAAGISRKQIWLLRNDVPSGIKVPDVDFNIPKMGAFNCFLLFPNATNVKPDFWIE